MQVGRDETIAEVRLMKVRDFLRWAGDCSVQFDAIKERFGCDEARAEQIGEALIDAGYLEDDPNETKPGKWYVNLCSVIRIMLKPIVYRNNCN